MQTITEHDRSPLVAHLDILPEDRSQWPRDAGESCRSLLRDLDHWSRENGFPMSTNAWIAEEAVRQSW